MLTAPVHLFNATCSIFRIGSAIDAYGNAVRTETLVANARCRLSSLRAEVGTTYDRQAASGRVAVYFDSTVHVREGDRLEFVDKFEKLRQLTVVGVTPFPPFDPIYQRADCEEIHGDYPDGR